MTHAAAIKSLRIMPLGRKVHLPGPLGSKTPANFFFFFWLRSPTPHPTPHLTYPPGTSHKVEFDEGFRRTVAGLPTFSLAGPRS